MDKCGRLFACSVLFCFLAVLMAPPAPGADILVVVDTDDPNDAAGNQSIVDRLQLLGHTTTMINDNGSQLSDAEGKDLVVISSSSNSGDVGTKYTDQDATFHSWAIPTINWENALNDEFLFADSGSGPTSDSIIITALGASHPLGAGLSEGTHVVRNSAVAFHGIDNANLAPGAQIIATHSTGSNAIIVVEPGGLLNDGVTTASARRIGMFYGDPALDNLNDAGFALFDAAVSYALVPEPSSIVLCLSALVALMGMARVRRKSIGACR